MLRESVFSVNVNERLDHWFVQIVFFCLAASAAFFLAVRTASVLITKRAINVSPPASANAGNWNNKLYGGNGNPNSFSIFYSRNSLKHGYSFNTVVSKIMSFCCLKFLNYMTNLFATYQGENDPSTINNGNDDSCTPNYEAKQFCKSHF